MKTAKIVSLLVLVSFAFISCNMMMGSDPSGAGAGVDGPSAEEVFRAGVAEAVEAIPADPAPEDVFTAGIIISAVMKANSIELTRGLEILNEEVVDLEILELLLMIVADGYSLQEMQSEMTGIAQDPEQQITAALNLDENIDEDSIAQTTGDTEWVPGIDGSGIRLDAEGEYVSVPDDESLDLSGDEAAVEIWIYPENNIAAAGLIHKGVLADWSDESYSLQYNSAGQVAMIFTNEAGTPTYVISNEATLAEDEWHHIVVTWDMSSVWMYIDGALVEDLLYYQNGWKTELPADFAPIRDTDGDLLIGAQPVPGFRFEGIIDNVILYERIVTAEEAAATYLLYTE